MRASALFVPLACLALACGTTADPDDQGAPDMSRSADLGAAQPDLGPDPAPEDMGPRPDAGPPEGVVTEVIGSAGGTIEAAGVRLVVPPELLEETVEFSLRLLDPDEIPERERITGPAVDLGPDGQVFGEPGVELTLDDTGPAPDGFRKAVLRLNEVTMTWSPVAEGTRTEAQSIARLSSFSVYASGLVPTGGGNLMEGAFGCTVDGDCAGDLRCGIDFGPKFNDQIGNVCVQPHCVNEIRDELEAGVDCGGTDTCGTCRPFFTAGGTPGDVRYGTFPVGGSSNLLVDLAPDAEGGVFALFESGFLVQLDEDGNVLRSEFFIDPEMTTEPFRMVGLDHENDIILVDDRTVFKFDDSGSAIWTTRITGAQVEIRDMDFDCENNLIIVGYYNGAATVGGSTMLPERGFTAGFIVKIAPDGSVLHADGFADMQLEHVVAKTYGLPFIATCDYYVAGHSDGSAVINFTGDPADDIPGNPTRTAHAPFARFGPDDELVYAYRITGSPTYSFDGFRVINGILIEDFNPVLFGSGRSVLLPNRGLANGNYWGGRMDRNTGAIRNFFDIGRGNNFNNQLEVGFERINPFLATGSVNQEEQVGFFSTKLPVGRAGVITHFLLNSTDWVQTFTFGEPGGTEDFIMTMTAKGRPVVGLSLRASQEQTIEWAGGTFDASTQQGEFATFIAGFEP